MKKHITISGLIVIIIAASVGLYLGNASSSSVFSSSKLKPGTISGNIYTNEYADLTFAAPEEWVYATREEIAESIGASVEMLSEAGSELEYTDEILNNLEIYDMAVQNKLSGTNILLMFVNLKTGWNALWVNDDEYLNGIKEKMSQTQLSYNFIDITEEELCDKTYKVMSSEVPNYGATQYIYTRKVGKYIVSIIVTVFGDDDISDVMENFS